MNFTQLQYFVTVAQQGSVTKAAAALNIEQSALSKVIHRLEVEMNTSLFDRRGRAIVLNDAGRSFLEFAEQCVNSYQQVNYTIARQNQEYAGNLVIGTSIKSQRVYEILREFHRIWPGIHLTIRHVKNTQAAYDCDFVFGMSDYEAAYLKSSFTALPIWKEATCLMISEQNPLSRKESIRLIEARDLPFIMSLDKEFTAYTNKLFALANFTPVSTLRVDDPNLVAYMIQANLAVALNPEFTPFCHDIAGIHMLPLSVPEYYRQIFLYSAASSPNPKTTSLFYDFAVQYCKVWGTSAPL